MEVVCRIVRILEHDVSTSLHRCLCIDATWIITESVVVNQFASILCESLCRFLVNITVNDDEENFSPEEIRTILHNAFSRFMTAYGYNKCEQSTRVISMKVTDFWHSRIVHSCDFAIVHEGRDGQQYIRFNKEHNYFSWEFQTQPYKELESRADYLKENGHWNEVLEVYLDKKNNNDNPDKHSRSLYAETINECFRRHNNHK